MDSKTISKAIDAVQADLSQAEGQAAKATGEDLGAIGGMVAGLRAKLTALQGQRAAALTKEQERAAQELAKQQAQERAAAVAALQERNAAIVARFEEWQTAILAQEDQAGALFDEYYTLQGDIRRYTKDAEAVGAADLAPIILEPSQRLRRMQAGVSPILKWPARRKNFV